MSYKLNHEIYSPKSIEKATKDYSEYCSIKRLTSDGNNTVIEVLPTKEYLKNSDEITNEFLNYVLDLSIKNSFEVV